MVDATVEICTRIRNNSQPCGNRIFRMMNHLPYCYTCGGTEPGDLYVKVEASMRPRGETLKAMSEEISDFTHHMSELDANDPIPDDEWDFWMLAINLMTMYAAEVFDA